MRNPITRFAIFLLRWRLIMLRFSAARQIGNPRFACFKFLDCHFKSLTVIRRDTGVTARSRLVGGQNFSTSNSGCDQVDAYSPQMVDEVFRKSRSPIKAAIPPGRKYERSHHGTGWVYAALWNTH
jgi:hypothetical protein